MVHAAALFSGSSAKQGVAVKPTQNKLVKKMNLPMCDKERRDNKGLFPDVIEIEPIIRKRAAVMFHPPGKLLRRLFNGDIAF